MVFSEALIFAACAFLCASQPVEKLPVLKETPSEVLFRVSENPQPLLLECVTTVKQEGVTYKWLKNGKEFQPDGGNVMRREGEGTLVFVRPTAHDEGEYRCHAESELGVASSRPISVRRAYIDAPEVRTHKHRPVEGRPYKLDCPVPDAYPRPDISWVHQFESDPSIANEVADSRVTVSPEGTMYISSVKQSDASDNFKYVCVAKSPAVDGGVPLVEHYIESLEKDPQPPNHDVVEQYASGDQTAKFGETLFLYCIYGGDPLAHPDWYKDGKNVNNSPADRVTRYNKSKGKRLLIREVWLEDEGEYTCLVDNEVGRPLNHTMHLSVIREPEFALVSDAVLDATEGQDLLIPCKVYAVPNAKVTWTYNAKPLEQSDRLTFKPVIGAGETVADLTIKKVQRSDTGYYGCYAENEHGRNYTEVLVHV